jgi:hypothetical protein
MIEAPFIRTNQMLLVYLETEKNGAGRGIAARIVAARCRTKFCQTCGIPIAIGDDIYPSATAVSG